MFRQLRFSPHMITALLFLCLLFTAALLMPETARAEEEVKTVRVGWYPSPFNTKDENGRRSGYAYEYQRKIAAYTGWHYEYVEASWSELMDKLAAGEIDLMSDVSFTEERTKSMLFSSLSMGTEEYYLFIDPSNKEFTQDDNSYFNGKRVGVNRGSFQISLFQEWEAQNGISAEIVELTGGEADAVSLLQSGDIDAYLTIDAYGGFQTLIPVTKIGSSDFYFAVNKNRPDLLAELDEAMNKIQEENRFYNQELFEKHFRTSGANLFLNAAEKEWLFAHGPLRVGYQDNYLAFCAEDPDTGELTGALKDFLTHASDCLENAHLEFETFSYPTAQDAMNALKKGEVDCMFPANLGDYDGEEMGLVLTPPMMSTEIYAVLRTGNEAALQNPDQVVAAVNEGNPNYDAFLQDHFPHWEKHYYPDTAACLEGVSRGTADCMLLSNFRINNVSKLCARYGLTSIPTGTSMEYCFAVNTGETDLYSILGKIIAIVPDPTINASLSYYITADAKTTFSDFMQANMPTIVAVLICIILLNIAVVRVARVEKKADEGAQLISATEYDQLTGLYQRSFFFEYANRMYREHPGRAMDAIVLNIERFHAVNEINGRDFGDQVLRVIGSEIRSFLESTEGIGGRFEGDRFDIYCKPQKDYLALLNRFQQRLAQFSQNSSIRLRMGVMPWQAGIEPVQLFDRARTASSSIRGSKNHLMIYDREMQEREEFRQRLLNDLSRALREKEFRIFYQPKYSIQGETPVLDSAEALIRWQHPELGLLSPGSFIPLFEENGQISEIDNYVWNETARQIASWRDRYGISIPVSVNLSRVDALDSSLEQTLDNIVLQHALNRSSLHLEVTESAYTEDGEQLSRIIHRLRKKGYKIEMDDFGSGYSSLNMLSSIPFDVLKMDRAFILNIEHNEKDVRLVELIVNIAKSLKIPVIAEGVETRFQLDLLKDLGCAIVQGYYFSRPLPPEEFEQNILL